MMNRLMVLLTFTFVQALSGAIAHADDYSSYDDIIRDLRGSTAAPISAASGDATGLAAVKIHAGVALVSSRVNFDLPKGVPGSKGLRGVEAAFGIDLFSPQWIAEGSVRNFNREKFAGTNVSLKEFDLKLVHKHAFNSKVFGRFGGGMAARYLDFDQAPVTGAAASYTTPASIVLVGVGSQITPGIALSAEAAYRSALIDETIDENSLDGAIRFTGSF